MLRTGQYHNQSQNADRARTGQHLNKATLLNAFPCVQNCSESNRSAFLDACSVLNFRAGQTLVWEGERTPYAILVSSGRVRVLLIGPKGREVQLYRLEEGEACAANLMSVVNHTESTVHLVAETDVKALCIEQDDFDELLRTNNFFYRFVMDKINSGMSSTISMVKSMAFVRVEERVADFFVRRYTDDGGENSVIRTTHADIAMEIGTAREVISRILKQFERAGAIEVKRGQIIIKSLGHLRVSNHPNLAVVS